MNLGQDAMQDVLLRFAIAHPLPTPDDIEELCAEHEGHEAEIRRYAATLLADALDPNLGDGSMDPDEEAQVRRRARRKAKSILADLRGRARTVGRRRQAWAGPDR